MKKKINKIVLLIISIPLILFINPLSIKIGRKLIVKFDNLFFRKKLKHCGNGCLIGSHNRFVGLNYVRIGNDFSSMDGLWLSAIDNYSKENFSPTIEIGNSVSISRYCHISAIDKVKIGNNCLIGSNVLIIDSSHGDSDINVQNNRVKDCLTSKGPIEIGDNTWICDNVTILSGVTIGKNCIIAANSVVNKSFPNNVVIAGNPAKIIKAISNVQKEA